jgi:hypothetical protein
MTLRAFTAQHKLQDTEEQYLQAVYRFRDAEQKQSLSYTAVETGVFDGEDQANHCRYCCLTTYGVQHAAGDNTHRRRQWRASSSKPRLSCSWLA